MQQTQTEINYDIPEFIKLQDLKCNQEIKGLPQYVREHVIPVLEKKTDQTIKQVLELLDLKYGQTRTEKV